MILNSTLERNTPYLIVKLDDLYVLAMVRLVKDKATKV